MSYWDKLLSLDANYTRTLSLANIDSACGRLASLLAHSGDSWFCLMGLVILWALGNAMWKQIAVSMTIGILVTAIIVFAIKFTVRRQRPVGEWGNIYRKTDPHSFPSGHAARVIMMAILGLSLGPLWFGLALCIWAPIVMFARVAMGVHYLLDVIAGGLLGGIIGIILLWMMPKILQYIPALLLG